jgi:hypothetical protein
MQTRTHASPSRKGSRTVDDRTGKIGPVPEGTNVTERANVDGRATAP